MENKRGRKETEEEKKLYKQEKTVLSNYWQTQLEARVRVDNTNKSKFIRDAIIEKLKAH